MKKVRREDLKNLFREFYCDIIREISMEEYIKLPSEERLYMNVNSVYVKIWWRCDATPQINEENIRYSNSPVIKFMKKIEEMTLEEIKGIEYGIVRKENVIEIYFANAYEVID